MYLIQLKVDKQNEKTKTNIKKYKNQCQVVESLRKKLMKNIVHH